MRATVTDKEAVGALRPMSVTGYLRSKGWLKFSELSGRFSVWHLAGDDESEVVIPARKDSDDYALRLSLLLQELARVEQRSQVDILRDMLNSGFDVVRVRAASAALAGGSIKISDGGKLVAQARELLLAAACSAIRPRAVFHTRKPQKAVDYLDVARMGQTEHGSFVLTLLSPVSPQLAAHGDTELFPDDPFERSVVKTLTSAVNAAVAAAVEAATATKPDFQPFQEAVKAGVSANLCEGLTGLFHISEASEITVSVGWAQTRPVPDVLIPSRTLISADTVPTIEEAARIFRARDALTDYLVQGPVVRLDRPEGVEVGQATIYAPVDGAMRKVIVDLERADYDRATLAHKEYRAVKVVGTVKKVGRSFRVEEPRGFDVSAEIAADEEIAELL